MNEEQLPLEAARQAIRAGKLPARRPDRTWGGTGSGSPCAICGQPVTPDEVEIELEFAGDYGGRTDRGFHVHVRCLSAWELELERLQEPSPMADRSARPAARALPTASPDGRIARRGRTDQHQREREEFRD
ncbi:MAG TPA: hypothetical protein VF210_07960 [Pseudomonadales bacterium]